MIFRIDAGARLTGNSSKPPSSNSSLAGTPKNQLEEQKKLLESMREERIKRREAKDKKKQDSELAEHNCKQAKGQLKTYEEMPRLFTLDDQGERHYLSDAERKQSIEHIKKDIHKWCK